MNNILALLCTVVLLAANNVVLALDDSGYQGYYNYLRNDNYPSRWSSTQYDNYLFGITHSADHWYISQHDYLWRIPVTTDLNTVPYYLLNFSLPLAKEMYADIGIGLKYIEDYPELSSQNFNRFSDLAFFSYNGWTFLFTTVWSEMDDTNHPDNNKRALAVFDGVTLELIDFIPFPGCPLGGQAFDSDGILFGMRPSQAGDEACSDNIIRYQVDWPTLLGSLQLVIVPLPPIGLPVDTWNRFIGGFDAYLLARGKEWISVGCDVSPDGLLLYCTRSFAPVVVLELATGTVIQESTDGIGYFDVDINPSADAFPAALTIWDMDVDGRAPGITGQLHILMRNHDTFSSDEIGLLHYSNKIWIDPAYVGEEWGTPDQPITTTPVASYWAWDRSVLMIPGGNYPDPVTFDNRILFEPITDFFGPVILGE